MVTKQDIGDAATIDVHTHAGGLHIYNFLKLVYPTTQDVRDLVMKAQLNRVDNMIVSPMPTPLYYEPLGYARRDYHASGLEKYPFELSNKSLLHDTELHGQNVLLPFMAIHPTEKPDEQICFLEVVASRIWGLKLHTFTTNTKATDLIGSPFMDFLIKFNLPILIHSRSKYDVSNAIHILELAEHYPQVRICIAHLADFDKNILSRVMGFPNLFVDTSPFLSLCQFACAGNFEQVSMNLLEVDHHNPPQCLAELDSMMPGRVVWGTDEPWTATCNYTYGDERGVLDVLADQGYEASLRAVASANPARFLLGENEDSHLARLQTV